METVVIFPIGGLLLAIVIAIVLILVGMFQGVTSNPNVIMEFATNHTDTILVIFGVISVICIFLAMFIHYFMMEENGFCDFSKKRKKITAISRGLLLGVTLFNSLTAAYWIVITWVNDFVKSCNDFIVFFFALLVIPFAFIWVMILVILTLLPNLLMFLPEMSEKLDSTFMVNVLPVIIAVIANSIYLFMIITGLVPML